MNDTHTDRKECLLAGEILLPALSIPDNEWTTQNKRECWHQKYRKTSAVKRRMTWTARNWKTMNPNLYGRVAGAGRVRVVAVIHPPTRRRYDPENTAPMVKAILDALTGEGFWADDDSRHLQGPDYRGGSLSPDGTHQIELHITPIDTPQEGETS